MPETRVVRIDEALVDVAKTEGTPAGRSTSAQLTYWARLGRAVESSGVPATAIQAVLGQQAAFDELSEEDQAAVTARWNQQMGERLTDLDMAAHHEAAGTPYAELDDEGNVVVVESTAPVSAVAERMKVLFRTPLLDSGVLTAIAQLEALDSDLLAGLRGLQMPLDPGLLQVIRSAFVHGAASSLTFTEVVGDNARAWMEEFGLQSVSVEASDSEDASAKAPGA